MTVGILLKQRRRLVTQANAKSKSEKFPPPHQDGQLGFPLGASHHIDPAMVPRDVSYSSTSLAYPKERHQTWSGPLGDPAGLGASRRKKHAAVNEREPSKPHTAAHKDRSADARGKGKNSIVQN